MVDSAEEYAMRGPFAQIFQNPIARVLDQSMIVGNMEQTISMLSESTNLSYKTVEKAVNHLVSLGFIGKTRRIGNAQAYQFKVEHELSDFINCALRFQSSKISEVTAEAVAELPEMPMQTTVWTEDTPRASGGFPQRQRATSKKRVLRAQTTR